MIRAGKYTVEDSGFTVTTERIGGLPRQAVVVELPGGITGTALDALCAGPIEVLNEKGEVVQTHTGPFRITTHGLKWSGRTRAATWPLWLLRWQRWRLRCQGALSEKKAPRTRLQASTTSSPRSRDSNSVQSADKAQGPEAADGTSSL